MGGTRRRVGITVQADVRDFNAGMASASRSVRSLVLEMGAASQGIFSRANLMQAGIAGVAVGAVAALKSTVGAAAAFEVQMRNVNSIVHASEGEFQKMSTQVLALAEKFPQSADTLAAGLYDIASSGFQGAEGIQVLEASARAATAGMTDTATAARAITAVLNAYGLEASDAADVSDILFQTVNVGVLTFEELATTLGDVVGIAAAAGVDIAQLNAALSAMTLSGISAAEAGTSLNRLIQQLVQPSEALAGVWKTVSDETIASTLAQEGLGAVMEKLRGVVGGNVQVLLALFPEIRAARGAFAVLANEGANYLATQAAITDEQRRAHATQKAFNEQMQATSNQLKLVANGARVWGIELGSKVLPAVGKLISGGREFGHAVVPAFKVFGDVLGYIGELAGSHLEIVYAIVAAYTTKLLVSIIATTGAWIANTAAIITNKIALLVLQVAIAGVSASLVALGAIAGAVIGALAVGAAINSWHQANQAAQEYVDTLKEGKDLATHSGLKEYSTALQEQANALAKSKDAQGGLWNGLRNAADTLIPGVNNAVGEQTALLHLLDDEVDRVSKALANEADNFIKVAQATGLGSDAITAYAEAQGIDLKKGGAEGRRAVAALTEMILEDAEAVGLTKEQFASLGVEGVEAITKITDAAADAKANFLDTFGLLADFELPDPEKAAKDAADAADKVRDAEEKLADARAKARDFDRYLVRNPERDRDAAKARRDVAEAERDLAEAREESRKAAEVQLDPEKAIEEEYRKQIDAARQFVEDIGAVAEMGKGKPGIAEFLLKAQLNPEEYGPILRAIVEDTDGTLLNTISASENRLKELGATFEGQFGVMKTAVDVGMGKITDAMLDHLERAFTDPDGTKGLLAFKFGAYLVEQQKKGQEEAQAQEADNDKYGYGSDAYAFAGGGGGNFRGRGASGEYADGGIQPHIAKSMMIKYGEPSTGGEAYIPLGPQHRARSISLWEIVGHHLGVIPMQRGGIVGGPGGPTGPTSNSWKRENNFIFNGDIKVRDLREAERHAQQKSRLMALTGRG